MPIKKDSPTIYIITVKNQLIHPGWFRLRMLASLDSDRRFPWFAGETAQVWPYLSGRKVKYRGAG